MQMTKFISGQLTKEHFQMKAIKGNID